MPLGRPLRATLALALLAAAAFAGCTSPFKEPEKPVAYTDLEGYVRDETGADPDAWPDLEGVELTLIDNGAFSGMFNKVAPQFRKLTGIEVKLEDGVDTVEAYGKVKRGHGKYDLFWGVDNMILSQGVAAGDYIPYKPALADRVDPRYVFFGDNGTWHATPADHGYIAVNIDRLHADFNQSIEDLADVARYADRFVTQDPRRSAPGLGFLLMTIEHFGEDPDYSEARYTWKEYWTDLLEGPDRNNDGTTEGCVLVAPDWETAYVQHFSAGYGVSMGGLADKPLVVSYTQSPAYEAFFGASPDRIAKPLYQQRTAYHHIQAIAIVNGTQNVQAAQAWVEFTLTDYFQDRVAENDVMYPVVAGIGWQQVFRGLDPAPGSFEAVEISQERLAFKQGPKAKPNLERWVDEWVALYDDADINCDK